MKFILPGLLIAASTLSCDRAPAPLALPPTTRVARPVTAIPATQPVRNVIPENAVFIVSAEGYPNQQIVFPPARILVSRQEDQIHLTIQSNDPPEAMKDGYTGNSFRFDYLLAAGEELIGSSSTLRENQTDEGDDKNGLFLQGGRQIAQPQLVTIKIEGTEESPQIEISGNFQLTAQSTEAAPQIVVVRARLLPECIVDQD